MYCYILDKVCHISRSHIASFKIITSDFLPSVKLGIQKSSEVPSNKSKHISVKELRVTAVTPKQQVFCTNRPVVLDLFVWKRAKSESRTLAPLRLYSLYVKFLQSMKPK